MIDCDTLVRPISEAALRSYCNRIDPYFELEKREFRQWLIKKDSERRLFL